MLAWLPLITAAFSLVGLIVKTWQDGAPGRKERKDYANTQEGREDIASGNVGAVALRIDSVQPVQTETATGDSSRLATDQDTARRIAAITSL